MFTSLSDPPVFHTGRRRVRVAPDLRSRPPRPARYTLLPRLAQIAGLMVWLCAIGWIVPKAQIDLGELAALRQHGIYTRALMCYSYDRFGKKVTYCRGNQYLAGSHTFEWAGRFWLGHHALVLEEPVVITYLPSHPETVRIGAVSDERVTQAQLAWAAGIGLGGTVTALLLSWCFWGFALQRTLLCRGTVQDGMVTAKGYTNMLGRTVYAVFYTFSVGEGQIIHGTRIPKRLFPKFEQGMKITILYLPENPQCSLPAEAITAARL